MSCITKITRLLLSPKKSKQMRCHEAVKGCLHGPYEDRVKEERSKKVSHTAWAGFSLPSEADCESESSSDAPGDSRSSAGGPVSTEALLDLQV